MSGQDELVQHRIRRATVDDQAAIGRLVQQAGLNPRGLDWRRFLIAEAGGAPIGVAQVRRHPDGGREPVLLPRAVGLLGGQQFLNHLTDEISISGSEVQRIWLAAGGLQTPPQIALTTIT